MKNLLFRRHHASLDQIIRPVWGKNMIEPLSLRLPSQIQSPVEPKNYAFKIIIPNYLKISTKIFLCKPKTSMITRYQTIALSLSSFQTSESTFLILFSTAFSNIFFSRREILKNKFINGIKIEIWWILIGSFVLTQSLSLIR